MLPFNIFHYFDCCMPLLCFSSDLLSSDPTQKLDIKMNPDGTLYVPGLTDIEVQTLDDINQGCMRAASTWRPWVSGLCWTFCSDLT